MPNILNICLTGGPCSGKTTTIEMLKNTEYINGYKVLLIPESATLLITHGIKPKYSEYIFQKNVFNLQLFLSELFENYAKDLDEDTVIIHDRGLQDALAYIDEESFYSFCKTNNFNNIFNNYDCVIHLVSIAYDKPELYNTDNDARRENLTEAVEAEKKTLSISKLCNNLFVVDNECEDFNQKYNKVIDIIKSQIDIKEKLFN